MPERMTVGHMNAGFSFDAQKVDKKSSRLSLDRVNISLCTFICVREIQFDGIQCDGIRIRRIDFHTT